MRVVMVGAFVRVGKADAVRCHEERTAAMPQKGHVMPNIPPQPKLDQIVWFENHIPLWAAAPTTFGLNALQVTALQTLITNARKAYNDAQAARDASKAATTSETTSVASMLASGRAIVNIMKAFIENAHNPALWGQAGLEPDASGGTAPSPVPPYQLSASLDSQGDVIVHWKAAQPRGISGIIYSIRRSFDGGAYTLLDSVGGKMFTDETVPVGTHSVSYAIQARRGTQMSEWSESLTVRFGRIGGGLAITSSETTPAGGDGEMKLAA